MLGVWPDGSDGTDINSLCRSHNERVVAVADDFCKVHLFQYPCARAKVRPLRAFRTGWAGPEGFRSRRYLVGVPFRPGAEPRVRRPRQPRDQRPVYARRLPSRLPGWQGRKHLPVAGVGCRGCGAGARHALSNPFPVPRFLSRCLTAARWDPPASAAWLRPTRTSRTRGRPFPLLRDIPELAFLWKGRTAPLHTLYRPAG